MESLRIRLVEFIGGPFDGFRQETWEQANELPPRVAIPLNERAARLLGMHSAALQSDRKVIYILQISDGIARYCFQSEIDSGVLASPAACGSVLREPRNGAE